MRERLKVGSTQRRLNAIAETHKAWAWIRLLIPVWYKHDERYQTPEGNGIDQKTANAHRRYPHDGGCNRRWTKSVFVIAPSFYSEFSGAFRRSELVAVDVGHSLRAGHATSTAIAGASERSIMSQT